MRATALRAAELAEHVGRLPARRGDQRPAETRAAARCVLAGQRGQRLGVEPLHLGQREGGFGRAGMRDDRLAVSASSAFQALSETMHSPVPFGLLKPGS